MVSKQLAMYQAAAWVAQALPASAASALGRAVGWAIGCLPDYDGRRAVVASHMARATGRTLSRREAKALVAAVFANYGRYWAETFRLPVLSESEVGDGVECQGRHHLERALAAGRGAIVAAPHLGGWEWGAIYLVRRGIPVTVVVELLEPREAFVWFAEFRSRLGMNVVPVGPEAGAAVLSALKANHVVCLLSDRLVGQTSGVEVDFFGSKLLLPAGPVTLALRSGCPLLAAAIYCGRRAGSHTLVFRPPLDLSGLQGRLREQVRLGTEALAHELESLILPAPTQWHLVQPNWPDDPPLRRLRDWPVLRWAGGAGEERAKRAGRASCGSDCAGRAGGR